MKSTAAGADVARDKVPVRGKKPPMSDLLSDAEALLAIRRRARELRQFLDDGVISDLQFFVSYPLTQRGGARVDVFEADIVYRLGGRWIAEFLRFSDNKTFVLKRELASMQHGLEVVETADARSRFGLAGVRINNR